MQLAEVNVAQPCHLPDTPRVADDRDPAERVCR